MSLNKLFNFKFLFQNIKKSKMTIALFFIIVPIFTSLMIISLEYEILDFINLAFVNIFGMYIIPFIFSVCLFGYLYKKNSVDFIGSMPISRKCMFITNTVGGIGLILLLQLITFVLTLLLGAISDCIIFPTMAIDILVIQTIAYIFVFTIANLAMSLSGNVLTQIVVTLLITFLIPFSSWYVQLSNGNNDYKIIDYENTVLTVEKINNYTAPFLIADNGNYGFNKISICKMSVLIVIYFALGLIAFNKRKMEFAGESFENKYIHFIVKWLTLIPFIVILIELNSVSDFSVVAIVLAIITIYYFIYDLITGKRVKVRENIVGLVFSVLVLFGTYSLLVNIDDKMDKKFDINEIKSVEIENNSKFKLSINDKEEIKNIIKLAGEKADYYSGKGRVRIFLEITRFNGTRYKKAVYVYADELSNLIDDSFKKITINENAVIGNTNLDFTNEEEKDLRNKLNETFGNITYSELNKITNSDSNITLYEYKNHELETWRYPINVNKEVASIAMNGYNRYACSYINSTNKTYYHQIDFHGNVSDEVENKMNITLNYCDHNLISDFIKNNNNFEAKDYDKCLVFYSSYFRFYTDKVDVVLEMLNEVYELNKEEIDNEYDLYYKESEVDEYHTDDVETIKCVE